MPFTLTITELSSGFDSVVRGPLSPYCALWPSNQTNALWTLSNVGKFQILELKPVIFASALISIPSIIGQFIKKESLTLFINKWLTTSSATGFILYILLIFVFSYVYTFIQLKPDEMSDNLNKNGGYIPGIRPGDETEKYISKVLKKLTVVGALGLAFIAALPILFGLFSNLPTSVTIGGTGLLIVVGVALETYKQIESQLVSRNYTKGRRRK